MLLFFTPKVNLNLVIVWFCFVAFVAFALFSCFSFISSFFHFSLWGRGFCPVCILMWHGECLGHCRDVHTLMNTRAPIVCEAWMVHCTCCRLLTERWWGDAEFRFSMSTRVQTAVSHLVFLFCCCLPEQKRATCIVLVWLWALGGEEGGIHRDAHQDQGSQCFWNLWADSMLCRMNFTADLKLKLNCWYSGSCGRLEKKTADFWVFTSQICKRQRFCRHCHLLNHQLLIFGVNFYSDLIRSRKYN